MDEQKDAGPDRGLLDLRGLFLLFIGLAGGLVFYANDRDATRAAVWFVMFCGGGIALIARAFKRKKPAGLIVALSSVAAAILLYTGETDNLTGAIILALVGVGGGAYLMLPPSPPTDDPPERFRD